MWCNLSHSIVHREHMTWIVQCRCTELRVWCLGQSQSILSQAKRGHVFPLKEVISASLKLLQTVVAGSLETRLGDWSMWIRHFARSWLRVLLICSTCTPMCRYWYISVISVIKILADVANTLRTNYLLGHFKKELAKCGPYFSPQVEKVHRVISPRNLSLRKQFKSG